MSLCLVALARCSRHIRQRQALIQPLLLEVRVPVRSEPQSVVRVWLCDPPSSSPSTTSARFAAADAECSAMPASLQTPHVQHLPDQPRILMEVLWFLLTTSSSYLLFHYNNFSGPRLLTRPLPRVLMGTCRRRLVGGASCWPASRS